MVFPAHNVPVESPSELPKLLVAIRKVQAGKVRPVSKGQGKVHYDVDGFIFLMATPK